MTAPDLDRDAFELLAAEIRGIANGITLYAASNDVSLEASRVTSGNRPRAGDVQSGVPMIVAGIDTIDISSVSTAYISLNHSGYAEQSDLLTDLGLLFRSGVRPPDQRMVNYKRVTTPSGGVFWRSGL